MIIVWSVLYIIAYFITWFASFILIAVFVGGLFNFFSGDKHVEVRKNSISFNSGSLGIALLFIALISPYFLFSKVFSYYPPFLSITEGKLSRGVIDDKISSLTSEAERIKKSLENVQNLTINQIQNELSNTLAFIEKLQRESIQQRDTIERLIKQVESENKKAEEAQRKANEVSQITKPQLEAIKSLITEDAKKENQKSFWFGVLLSFPVGVFASLMAAWLITKTKRASVAVTKKDAESPFPLKTDIKE